MAVLKPWAGMDPNSQHQIWSKWTFTVRSVKTIPLLELKQNVARWLRMGFGSVGEWRVVRKVWDVIIEVSIEGVPAHDPSYVNSVRRGFRDFVEKGWGVTAIDTVDVKIMAGDQQDGRPRSQMIVMPSALPSVSES